MKIGLFFGSFNPIHNCHLMVASYIANSSDFKQVLLVVSPQNPHKPPSSLLSYTIDTLTYIQEQYPQHEFSVIMGGDSFQNLPKWKNFEALKKNYRFIVYRRPGFEITDTYGADITYLEAPMLELSATLIRNNRKEGITIRYLVPEKVREEIENNNYFKD